MDSVLIAVCVPVYNGAWCLEETLATIFKQTYKHLKVLISVDLCDDQSAEICRQYSHQATVFIQERHLGWVANCNFLIREAVKLNSEYFSIIPHDDLLEVTYFEKLLEGFAKYPAAVNCFPRCLIAFGNLNQKIIGESIEGSLTERIIDTIQNHIDAISFRGLIKRGGITDLLLYLNDEQSVMADTIWILQHAIAGELRAIDVKYYKRYHSQNEHAGWHRRGPSDQVASWVNHCAIMYQLAQPYLQDNQLMQLCQYRLLRRTLIPRYSNPKHLVASFKDRVKKLQKKVVILGGGFQACCIALMLQKYNYDITIIEQCTDIMNRASMNQEGKIHLGFIYSMDKSLRTGRNLLRDALHFSNYIEYLLGEKIDWDTVKSSKFNYLVPYQSLLTGRELNNYFEKLQNLYVGWLNTDLNLSYLGERPQNLFHQHSSLPSHVDPEFFKHSFATEEVSISQLFLKNKIKPVLDARLLLNEKVLQIKRAQQGFKIKTDKGDYQADLLFNCTWENQTVFDQQMGIDIGTDHNLRLKFAIVSKTIEELKSIPSCTIVNGPFGDYVNHAGYMYFSWYPQSMREMIVNRTPPEKWNALCRGEIDENLKEELIRDHQAIFQQLFLTPFQFHDPQIVGGIIVAKGDKDIKYAASRLHMRDETPITHQDGYFSVSTNKFTSAPYNTLLLEAYFK